MNRIIAIANYVQSLLDKIINSISFLSPLMLRLYLASRFWTTGWNKLNSFDGTAAWFESLGIPFPEVNAVLAISAEIGGASLLLVGLATRWACIPLLFTMAVAAATVHLKNGWQVIYDKLSAFPPADIDVALSRLRRAKDILMEYGNYSWLTEHGNIVMSNNGVEFVAAYSAMLLALMVMGGGSYISIDYWIAKKFKTNNILKGSEKGEADIS
jgi:uncharacterized membrane protein YphA (DoxX/SURF4 family)